MHFVDFNRWLQLDNGVTVGWVSHGCVGPSATENGVDPRSKLRLDHNLLSFAEEMKEGPSSATVRIVSPSLKLVRVERTVAGMLLHGRHLFFRNFLLRWIRFYFGIIRAHDGACGRFPRRRSSGCLLSSSYDRLQHGPSLGRRRLLLKEHRGRPFLSRSDHPEVRKVLLPIPAVPMLPFDHLTGPVDICLVLWIGQPQQRETLFTTDNPNRLVVLL